MARHRYQFLSLIVILTILASAIGVRWKVSGKSRRVSNHPSLEFPGEIQFGIRETGEVAEAPVVLHNVGESELSIQNIRSSCTCSGLIKYLDDGTRFERVTGLRLAPGQSVELAVRINVGRPSDEPVHNIISFDTNDPQLPSGTIVTILSSILGSLRTIPGEIVFESLAGSKPVSQVLWIVDDSRSGPRSVGRVTTNDPNRVRAELLPREQ